MVRLHAALRRAGFGLLSRLGRTLETAARITNSAAPALLSAAELRACIAECWDHFGREDDYILGGLFNWERAAFDKFLRLDSHVLLVGAGSGRDVIGLVGAGHRVDGLDVSSRALDLARTHLGRLGLHAELREGDIETADLATYDAIVFSWYCYSYLPGRERRIAVLDRARRHLAPGGHVILTFMLRDPGMSDRTRSAVARLAGVTGGNWRPEPGDVVSRVSHGVHFEHRATPEEIRAEGEAAGLRCVACDVQPVGLAVFSGPV